MLNMLSKLMMTNPKQLQENFIRGKPSFSKDMSIISELEQNFPQADRILLRTFNALQLKSGYLI